MELTHFFRTVSRDAELYLQRFALERKTKSPAHHCAGLKYAIENCVDYSAAASSAGVSVAGASAAGASAAAALRLRRVRFAFFSSLAMFSS